MEPIVDVSLADSRGSAGGVTGDLSSMRGIGTANARFS